jgi:endonuclease/exonuclease/phosphatase (EEP) superfamily protein YafD
MLAWVLFVLVKIGIFLYFCSALVPILKSDEWWVRVWDFPRLQLLMLGFLLGLLYWFATSDALALKIFILSVLALGMGFDLYRVLPYTPIWRVESNWAQSERNENSIDLLTANVLQENQESQKLISLINKRSPDVILLLEVNQRWIDELRVLDETYPFQVKEPLENLYGLALYSRLPMEAEEIRYLVEPNIPSVYAKIRLGSGELIDLYGVHPEPPRPDTETTTERDGELILVAKSVKNTKTPTIVMGDLNDVAWSHTTRLFRRMSGLLDPRVGRSLLTTFPVRWPFLRFPLDHLFHSSSFTLNSIERLPSIDSDHFALFVSLQFEPHKKDEQKAPEPDGGDEDEASETLDKIE